MGARYLKEDYIGNTSISIMRYRGTDQVLPHSHEFIEMIYVMSGSATHSCSAGVKSMSAGDYMFIDFDNIHAFTDKSADFSVLFCEFTPQFIDDTLSGSVHFADVLRNYLVNLMPYEDTGVFMFYDSNGDIKRRLDFMLSEYESKNRGYTELVRCGLLEIIILSMRNIESSPSTIDEKAKYIIKYINEHYAEDITLSNLADTFYCSVANLSVIFKKNCGMTFTRYLQRVRVMAACRLLRERNNSVDDVAEAVGYRDVRHFRAVFRNVMDTNPMSYRKRQLLSR